MDVETGAMGSLILKLGELLKEEYKLQAGVKEDVQCLKRELTSVYAALRNVSGVPWDQDDLHVKIWAGKARDMSYEIEDMVDRFLVRVEGLEPDVGNLQCLMKKMGDWLTKGKIQHKMASETEDIKANDVGAYSTGATMVDPRPLDRKELVGIDDSLNEVTNILSDGDGDVSKQLKMLSIVGFGGVGKTTLAKAVYDKLQAQFDCSAFVPVGQSPDVKKLLNDIIFGINKRMYPGLDERQLIDQLRGLLKNKRYFIVVDDIWSVRTLEMLKCAFVDNNCGSRIITTTRFLQVAGETGEVYSLKPLSRELSVELFNTRLFDGKRKCSYDRPTEAYDKILHKCGGVPLIIITMAGLLVGKPVESWSKVYNGVGINDENSLQTARRMLSLVYLDLPCHLRTCLLYLSIYPEDRMIEKDSLIWKWVAEGFVHKEAEVGLYETGERYFNELISKNMIQPVERSQHDGIIIGCRVHDMVLDMINVIAKEENFVTILNGYEYNNSSYICARRLAVGQRQDALVSTSMHQVRSFHTMCLDEFLPSLSCFQVLRVLALEGDILSEQNSSCLEHLGKLVHLRYLGLGKMVDVFELPKEIGDLKFLQILDLGCDTLEELPQSVCQLSQLKCLRFDGTRARVPDWIGNLTSLQELLLGSVNRPSNFVSEVGKLTELRKLRISGCLWLNSVSSVKAWAGSLVKLQKIKVLDVQRIYFDILSSC
ncbi:disease resistance protein RGA5-like [Triticum dicoccoides]|uniref:disease resistance protein RGA5-like n=1 Tax=Triticum dicoccoides TaxID=85692 RepID=UPI00188E0C60|nr:disease resistance protein RGA5-like [Triticum dicoccoides]